MGNRGASRQHGFTLIEITFAIVILAGSLVVLLGLQSASTQTAIRDARRQEAMLAARTLMSAIENAEMDIEVQERTAPVLDLLREFVPGEGLSFDPPEGQRRAPFESLTGTLVVEFWQLPGLDPEVVKRIRLQVGWSDSPVDSVQIVYFLPSGESAVEDSYEDE